MEMLRWVTIVQDLWSNMKKPSTELWRMLLLFRPLFCLVLLSPPPNKNQSLPLLCFVPSPSLDLVPLTLPPPPPNKNH
jgi:hypothetical protein